jgi:hypothetical protein
MPETVYSLVTRSVQLSSIQHPNNELTMDLNTESSSQHQTGNLHKNEELFVAAKDQQNNKSDFSRTRVLVFLKRKEL